MFSGVPTNTTFGSPVASESAPAPEIEYIAPAPAETYATPAPIIEDVAPAPVVENIAPTHAPSATLPAKSKSCRCAVCGAICTDVVESLLLSAPSQRSREERDSAVDGSGLSLHRFGLRNHHRSGFAVQEDPLLMHSGVMRSITGHEMSLSDIMTMICVFSANVLVDGGLVMPSYRFLHELGMRYRKAQSAKVRDIPPDVLEREERALLRKMVWLECTHEVPPERVFNLDETALTVLMLSQTGWAKINDAKDKIRFLGSDEKRVITLTLVVSRKGDMSAQIIFGGKNFSCSS